MKPLRRVLITGSSGSIGAHLARELAGVYAIRGFDRIANDEIEDEIVGDLSDTTALREACADVDAVIHLAGNRSASASWDEVLATNVVGSRNVFEAAARANVRRVVYASSCQVTFGYGEHCTQSAQLYPKPLSYYAASKVTAEQIGHVFARESGMSVICIRLGLFTANGRLPADRQITGRFLSHRDAVQLFRRAIDVIGVEFAVVYGASRSSRLNLDLEDARRVLGYIPDDAEDELHEVG